MGADARLGLASPLPVFVPATLSCNFSFNRMHLKGIAIAADISGENGRGAPHLSGLFCTPSPPRCLTENYVCLLLTITATS